MYTHMKRVYKTLTVTQLAWIALFFVLFINEVFVYYALRLVWPSIIASGHRGSPSQLRVMFVADPQLLGYRMDDPTKLRFAAVWDADRYVYQGFLTAYNYIQPEVVVFMGDLFDEGSTATDADFKETYQRFQNIFRISPQVKAIYIHGDNDEGGEAGPSDMKEKWKVDRFEHYFKKETGVARIKFLDIIKINYECLEGMTTQKIEELMSMSLSAPLRIIVNHCGVLEQPESDMMPILKILKPHFLFTAHTHMATYFNCTDCLRQNLATFQSPVQSTFELLRMKYRIQVSVPTCSYRMGTSYAGYGAAIFDSTGRLEYSILWLPRRILQLYSYIIFGLLVPFAYVVKCFTTRFCRT